MKAQISLHIYMGSVLCRPHIKRVCCCHEERKKKTKKGRMEHWEKESVGEEIMNSRKKIKRERNQGGVMRGQRDVAETLNEKEMGSWDKEVKKIKRRYDSSKEIKEHLHFAFSSAWAAISPLWRQTPAPTQNATNLNEWSWQIGLPEKWGCSFDWGEGLQTVVSPRQDKDITIIGRYTLLPLISDHGERRLEKIGQQARTDCHNS